MIIKDMVNFLKFFSDQITFFLVIISTQPAEEYCDVLLLLNDGPEELVSDILNTGGVPLQNQPLQDSGLVTEAAVVQVGDPILVVNKTRKLFHAKTFHLLLISNLHEVN